MQITQLEYQPDALPAQMRLPANELHVWFYPLDDATTPLDEDNDDCPLNATERARASRLITAELGHRFRAAHRGKRRLLACYLAQNAADLNFDSLQHGKPILAYPAVPDPQHPIIDFNLSHSQGWAALAVGRRRLGVDIEAIDPNPRWREILPQTAHDQDVIANADDFYRVWCAKEAVSKWDGRGLGIAFPRLQLHALAEHKSAWQARYEVDANVACTVLNLPTPDRFAAAVAWSGTIQRVLCYSPRLAGVHNFMHNP